MHIAILYIFEGSDLEKKRDFTNAVTEAICKSLDAPVQSVRVIINEMPKENYAIAGELICDREAAKH